MMSPETLFKPLLIATLALSPLAAMTMTAALTGTLAGCGSTSGAHSAAASSDRAPTIALTAERVRGTLEARNDDGAWQPVAEGSTQVGPRFLRATGAGAVLTFAGESGKLWIAGGAEVALGEASDGTLVVDALAGKARVSLFSKTLRAKAGGADATGTDVLLHRSKNAEQATVIPTASQPSLADWAVELEVDSRAAGVGTLRARAAGGSTAYLALTQLSVDARVSGDVVETSVEHVFDNPSDEQLEGTFRFPMPDGAIVIGLAMEIDDTLMEGELVEREKARKIYDEIVDQMQDPAILEWEKGNTFKLRVFPIEPKSTKRVVLRYLAPLERSPEGWAFRYSTDAPALKDHIDRFRLTFNGRTVVKASDYRPGRTHVVDVSEARSPAAVLEQAKDGHTYRLARVSPRWAQLPKGSKAKAGPRQVVFVFDTSRSALEGRELALQTLRQLLGDLREDDRFAVLSADVVVRRHTDGLVAPSPTTIDAAVAAVAAIEPDGATDLAAALKAAGALATQAAANAQVVYLGDGTATWGATDDNALRAAAGESLAGAPLFAAVVERKADKALLGDLAGASGGFVASTRSELGVRRFALRLVGAPTADRLTDVTVGVEGDGHLAYASDATTLWRGDELVVAIRTPDGTAAPKELTLKGRYRGQVVQQTILLPQARAAARVAERWALEHIEALERDGADREDIVKVSLAHGVMSKHTAFLVLESEEAYKKHKIERKKQAEQERLASARVTGADLESDGRGEAGVSPDQIMPGDPEIRVPAPADAREVLVVFPFGEAKPAVFEDEHAVWSTRFLIPKTTPDGTYIIRVRITHADGRVELLKLDYTVDTMRPDVDVRMVASREQPGTYWIHARQRITRALLEHSGLRVEGSVQASGERYASIVTDLKRVDVRLPDGSVVSLTAIKWGVFRGQWRPQEPLAGPQTLTVVAHDIANNHKVGRFTMDPAAPRWSAGDE